MTFRGVEGAGPSDGSGTAGCSTSGSPGQPWSPADLPPAHVGIHTGPVISQDGDVYGRTVNLAARIASYAHAGQVVVSQETAQHSGDPQVWFDPLGAVELKGIAKPLPLYQAYRKS